MIDDDFYAYTYRYPIDYSVAYLADTVFYVGKGKYRRIFDHERNARKGHQCELCNSIRQIWAEGKEVTKNKEYNHLTEKDAFLYEAILINTYGYKRLCNKQLGRKSALPQVERPRRGKREPYIPRLGHVRVKDEMGRFSQLPFNLDIPGERERVLYLAHQMGTIQEIF